MILDTMYFLPLFGIGLNFDLLKAIAEGRASIGFGEIKLSLISIFELRTKTSKLNISPDIVVKSVDAIFKNFTVIPFHRPDIIKYSHELRELREDYVDRVVVATAIARREGLVTEDTEIREVEKEIERRYKITIYTYKNVVFKT